MNRVARPTSNAYKRHQENDFTWHYNYFIIMKQLSARAQCFLCLRVGKGCQQHMVKLHYKPELSRAHTPRVRLASAAIDLCCNLLQ